MIPDDVSTSEPFGFCEGRATYGDEPPLRPLAAWTARAATSLPVPVSPASSTADAGRAATPAVRRLDRVRQAAHRIAVHPEAIDDDFDRAPVAQRDRVHFFEGNRAPVEEQPSVTATPQRLQRLGHGIEGGLARHVRKLAEPLVKQGTEVHVLTRGLDSSGEDEVEGVIVHRVAERVGTPEPGRLPPEFEAAMNDDLGTPAALAAVHDAVRAGNAALASGDREAARELAGAVRAILGRWRIAMYDGRHWKM